MEWLYIIGTGLNALGYQRFIRLKDPLDNTPALNLIQHAGLVGGLVFLAWGFFVFSWWVPLVGLVFGAAVVNVLIFWLIPFLGIPQLSIFSGLILSLVALLAA